VQANTEAKDVGIRILSLFALLFPVITLFANLAQLAILSLGGHFAISGSMSLGDFAAFNAYLALLIFPLIMIGFMSNVISQAQVSYGRIVAVLNEPDPVAAGTSTKEILGALEVRDLHLELGGKPVLRDVSLTVRPGTKNAIIGPTAAGKTQLLSILAGLLEPTSGSVTYDGLALAAYKPEYLHAKVALVFQDSVMFNLSLRENLAFGSGATDAGLEKAIRTAELQDVIANLPQGLDTLVSERGLNLSGGQKQRIMLARALALDPKVLLLDDFTARVDNETERRILANLAREYPDVTLISVTQKIASVVDFDQIVLLMEGEVFASGTHDALMHASPEYVQIYESQQSTTDHE
jgi:ATP-binding cassette subfamily B protein